ncbi:MAG: hypothetical protein DMF58_20325 [Acidobacteria bacterium]|nr:MAG: hypothetical protein DMF58_20325 [Acidobacteriota bacterium]
MTQHSRFVVCIKNSGYLASLKLRKLYEVVDDPEAEADEMIRVIDDSGEDYLYPAQMFLAAPLPASVEKALLETTESVK